MIIARELPDLSAEDIRRFWSKVDKNGAIEPHMDTPCWVWTGNKGYGKMTVQKIEYKATRLSFFIHTRKKPDPIMSMCHHCDNPPCVNPSHLFEGTSGDNLHDAMNKGRHNQDKISDAAVAFIREIYNTDLFSSRFLATEFNIAWSLVHRIAQGTQRNNGEPIRVTKKHVLTRTAFYLQETNSKDISIIRNSEQYGYTLVTGAGARVFLSVAAIQRYYGCTVQQIDDYIAQWFQNRRIVCLGE